MDEKKTTVEGFGNQHMPSVLNDPFKKSHVKKIFVHYAENWDQKSWSASGWVEFANGQTEGKQTFKGDGFDDVVAKMKVFIEQELK